MLLATGQKMVPKTRRATNVSNFLLAGQNNLFSIRCKTLAGQYQTSVGHYWPPDLVHANYAFPSQMHANFWYVSCAIYARTHTLNANSPATQPMPVMTDALKLVIIPPLYRLAAMTANTCSTSRLKHVLPPITARDLLKRARHWIQWRIMRKSNYMFSLSNNEPYRHFCRKRPRPKIMHVHINFSCDH